MKAFVPSCGVLLLVLPLVTVHAQGNSEGVGPKTQASNLCLNEVSKFEQAIAFIRDAQGVPAAAKLKEKLLPAKLEGEILDREGYCGLAKYLRDKRLL